MIKPDSLRAWLTGAVPELRAEPDRLQLFIDRGSLRSTGGKALAFEYRYRLNLILLDFAGDEDAVSAALLVWVGVNQPELLQNFDKNRQGIAFEIDILDGLKVDISIELDLTERVGVTKREGGGFDVVHFPEPEPPIGDRIMNDPADTSASLTELYANDELIASWPTT